MEKDLAIRIWNLGICIAESKDEIAHTRETVKLWEAEREIALRQLVELIKGGDDDTE